jgi:SHS2 domain-containing protein
MGDSNYSMIASKQAIKCLLTGLPLGIGIRYTQRMNNQATAGYKELTHTADWELEVWAPDLPGLLEQAALGMYTLCGVKLGSGAHEYRRLSLPYQDAEGLLVGFLTELLYYSETERLAFDEFKLTLEEATLQAELGGAPILTLDKEIKAVTYNELEVKQTERGSEARIVFDV